MSMRAEYLLELWREYDPTKENEYITEHGIPKYLQKLKELRIVIIIVDILPLLQVALGYMDYRFHHLN